MSEEAAPEHSERRLRWPAFQPLLDPRTQRFRLAAILLGVCVLLALLVVLYGREGHRSFAVDALTGRADIVFDGSERAVWKVQDAIICVRRPRGEAPAAASGSHPECASSLFDIRFARSIEFRWPADQRISIESDQTTFAVTLSVASSPEVPDEVDLGDGGRPLGPGSRIILDRDAMLRSSPFPVSGEVTIGAVPSAGVVGILREGRYVVRETLPWRNLPITVSEGSLFIGDRLSFVATGTSAPAPQHAYGFLAAGPGDDDAAEFQITAYSALGPSRLQIDRFGNETAFIAPSWTERAIKDPILIAFTALFSLLTLLGGLGRSLFIFVLRG